MDKKKRITGKITSVLKEISNAFSIRNFSLVGEHASKGYHGTAKDINKMIRSRRLPNFHSETNYKSQGKLFLLKLLLLLEEQKKNFSKKKYLTISPNEWGRLLYHYVGVRSDNKLRKEIKFWTNNKTGVLQKEYVKEKGKKTRVEDGYSLTPANQHIQKLFIGLGYDNKETKNSKTLQKLFDKDQNASEILKEIENHAPIWLDGLDKHAA